MAVNELWHMYVLFTAVTYELFVDSFYIPVQAVQVLVQELYRRHDAWRASADLQRCVQLTHMQSQHRTTDATIPGQFVLMGPRRCPSSATASKLGLDETRTHCQVWWYKRALKGASHRQREEAERGSLHQFTEGWEVLFKMEFSLVVILPLPAPPGCQCSSTQQRQPFSPLC